jgi:hypothetical protein
MLSKVPQSITAPRSLREKAVVGDAVKRWAYATGAWFEPSIGRATLPLTPSPHRSQLTPSVIEHQEQDEAQAGVQLEAMIAG